MVITCIQILKLVGLIIKFKTKHMTREEFKNLAEETALKPPVMVAQSQAFKTGALWAFDTLALPVFHQFYGPEVVPPSITEDGESAYVLIDLNGNQTHYGIGWYDHQDKRWQVRGDDYGIFDARVMTWTYIKRNDLTK